MLEPIAIVGIGCRFPGRSNDPRSFWRMLADGVDAITECPPERFDLGTVFDPDRSRPGKMYTRWGGFIEGMDQFDAGFFGFSMREALRIDPQHRILLEVAWEALEDAGIPVDSLAGSLTGVFVGISTHDYADVQAYPANRTLIDAHTNSGGAGSIAANRVSYVYDLRGPSFIVDTACSSSLVSVHLACQSLRNEECAIALAGGVQAVLNPELTIGFCKASMISPDGHCKAFSAEANGYVRGEGGGIVVLKRLSRALADGDRIHALIRGSAINEDGRTNGMTVPGLPAQQEVLREAYKRAGVAPGDVHYIEAHGPGTPVGDPIEAEALATVLACNRPAGEVLRIGSVKTNIGHLEAGSGIAGLIKAALVVKHRHIPPSLHFKTPNPAIPFESARLRVAAQGEAWPEDAPAFAGINSFGFGGANAHIVLEGPPPQPETAAPPADPAPRAELLVTSARSARSLHDLARAYRDLCRGAHPPAPSDLVAAAALQRSHGEHRLGVVGKDLEALADNLDAFLNEETRADVVAGRASHKHPPRVVFVFAGMGPQWWGMGRKLLATEPVFRSVIEACDRLIRGHAEWSLVEELMKDEANSRVAEADFAQPVNFAFQAALFELWKHWGVRPEAVVGHSAGEIAAVYATGAMDLEESVRVAFHRGRLQHRATGKGRMAAVGLGIEALRPLLADYPGRLAVAAINSPTSVTLSGDTDAVEEAAEKLQKSGAFCRVMSVQVPYHSHHMDSIEADLLESLAGLRLKEATTPIVSEVTGDWAKGGDFTAEYWWRNIRQPVLFGDAVTRLATEGFDTYLEVSPHPVLAASVNECVKAAEKTGVCLPSLRRNEDDRGMMLRSLAALYTRGIVVDWEKALGRPQRRVALPLYPWNKERVWLETAASGAMVEADARDTNILGRRLRSVQPHWEVNLKSPALDYLNDHKIHGAIVFPGAAYVAMALEIAAQAGGQPSVGLEGVEFRKALFVPENDVPRVQAVYEPGSRTVEIHAQSTAAEFAPWALHSGCRLITVAEPAPPPTDLAAVRARCQREVPHREFYDEVGKRGFTFGPRFMGVETLYQGDGEALGRVTLPESHAVEINGARVQPALFDAGLQVLIGAVTSREQAKDGKLPAFLPTRAARVVSHRPVGASFWSHATVQELTAESFQGTVSILDDDGNLLLQVEGLRAKTLEDLGAAAAPKDADLLYHQIWEEEALAGSSHRPEPGQAWCSSEAVAGRVSPVADRLSAELGFAGYYQDVEPGLERIARAFFVQALLGLKVDLREGARFATAALPDGTPLPEPRRRQLEALAEALADAGILVRDAGGFKVQRAPEPEDAAALARELRAARPGWASVIDLLARCGRALPDILSGRRSAPEVLFSGEGLADMAAFYANAPSCRLFNALTAEAVGAAMAERPPGREIRVLEVGAGTGGTTRYVLPRLGAGAFQFTFSDISPLFVNLARAEFGEGGPFRYAALDIGRDPLTQGFEPGSFDLVLGANVVHGTPDIARTLGHLKSLLAPGGLLVLQEITRRPRWLDVIFGITDGWWAFMDKGLRPDHALLDPATWSRVLGKAGFEEPVTLSETGDAIPGQSVLLARAPLGPPVPRAEGPCLVLADGRGVGELLAASLRQQGAVSVVARRGKAFRRLGPATYEIPGDSSSSMLELLTALEGEMGLPSRIVHLWSLETLAAAPGDAAALVSSQDVGYESMLHLVHALQAKGGASVRRCALVTAGAQAIEEGKDLTDVVQTPLWGFGRVLLHEHPELRPLLVDCSSEPGREEIEALAAEILAEERQDEIALRRSRRYVRRLVRLHLDEGRRAEPEPEPVRGRSFRAVVDTVGTLDSVGLRESPRRRPTVDEVEIEVKAASLNFRDVMYAMGMLPAAAFDNLLSAGAMGVDCAGVVTAVGAGVTHVRPGDEVVALSPASIASHAVTAKDLVVRKPKGMSFADAAALPLAYATALFSLETMAHLKRGERVLIHAATGGVGLAALSVAERAGAEIFATAGSEAKREYLRARGIRHVMDSRSLDFADQIMDITGGRGVDVVLNSLPGEAIAKGVSCLAPRGRFLEIGKADIYRNNELALQHFGRNLSFFAIQIDQLCDVDRLVLHETLLNMVDGVEAGALAPLPVQAFPLSALEEGLRTLAQARHLGKIVITAFDDPEIKLRGADPDGAPLFRDDATYLITGGRGGVGTALARWMVARGVRHLALLSRRAEDEANSLSVTRLRDLGVEVLLLSADVSDPLDVKRALAAAHREAAPLKGIFHGAMVIDDAPLSELDPSRFARVMAPKAGGAWNLHLATRLLDLDYFVLFSSITSVYGNARQANYGAANAFLDGLAGHRRAQGLPALTVNWGVFSDAGYVADRKEVSEYLARQGQHGFKAEEGFAAMEKLLRRREVQATIANTDWSLWAQANPVMGASPRFRTLLQERPAAAGEKAQGSGKGLERLLALDLGQRADEVADQLRRRMAKILGAAPDRVEMNTSLTDLGMDSLMAVELMTALNADFLIDVPAVKLLQGVTLDQLSKRVLEHLQGLGGGVSTPASAAGPVPLPAMPSPRPAGESSGGATSVATLTAPPPAPVASVAPNDDRPASSDPAEPVAARPSGLDYSRLDYSGWTPLQSFARSLVSGLVAAVADVTVEGLEHLPPAGPVLIAANHLSMWDAPVLLRYSNRRTVIFAAEELRKYPWIHWTLHKLWDAIYLRRGEGDTQALAQALDVLRGGGALGLSPEGSRTKGGLQRGLSGVAHLAFRSRAPILPVVLYGQENIPAGIRGLRRTKVTVRVAPAFHAPEGEPTAQAIQALTDRVMVEIARLLPREYRGVYAEAVEARKEE